jgi:hypothetical protein
VLIPVPVPLLQTRGVYLGPGLQWIKVGVGVLVIAWHREDRRNDSAPGSAQCHPASSSLSMSMLQLLSKTGQDRDTALSPKHCRGWN